MYKTITVHVDESPLADARLRAAAWLANAHEAHLVGCAATGISWPAYSLLTGSMAVSPIGEFQHLRDAARASLRVLVERTQATVGNALLGIAHTGGAGLLVAGAFGHSRYREIVMGGVTRVLLDRAPLPVLLAH